MIFCKDCFIDSEVQDIIEGLGKIGDCPICGSHKTYIYDTEKNNDLVELFESLIEIYTPSSILLPSFPKKDVQLLKDEIKQNWNIFNQEISSANIYDILRFTCSELYSTNYKLFDEPIAIKELQNKTYINNNCIIKNNTWDYFVNCIKHENRFHIDCIEPKIFDEFFNLSKTYYKKGQIFYRARIALSNDHGYDKEDMSAPPKESIGNGRANPEGIRCLYLASDIDTAIHEVRAHIFDLVSIGKFVLKKDITLVNLRRISNISPFVVNDLTRYAINKSVLTKINNEIAKSVSRNDSMLAYLPTQYICGYIKSIIDKESNTKLYDGIEYSSTTAPSGYNLAIFNPELFVCVSVANYKIESIDYNTKQQSKFLD